MQRLLIPRLSIVLVMVGMAQLGCDDGTNAVVEVVTPERAPLRAMSPQEYNHTVADLLGFPWNGKRWPDPHPISDSQHP